MPIVLDQEKLLVGGLGLTLNTFVLLSTCTLSAFTATRRSPIRPQYTSEKLDVE